MSLRPTARIAPSGCEPTFRVAYLILLFDIFSESVPIAIHAAFSHTAIVRTDTHLYGNQQEGPSTQLDDLPQHRRPFPPPRTSFVASCPLVLAPPRLSSLGKTFSMTATRVMTWKPLHVRYSVRDAVPRPHAPHRPGAHPSSSLNSPPYAQHATLALLAAHAASIAFTRTATPSAVLSLRLKHAPPVLHGTPATTSSVCSASWLFPIAGAALPLPSRAKRASVALPPRASVHFQHDINPTDALST
ncbi:hypothetical protein K438DRAFT_2021638 [Mycena galopus ATCC 62051]|nr:hypothetical protein K438DRAFT_2021638 [Mycena galopus ATCC 62051]